jgi:hypothetical protein
MFQALASLLSCLLYVISTYECVLYTYIHAKPRHRTDYLV